MTKQRPVGQQTAHHLSPSIGPESLKATGSNNVPSSTLVYRCYSWPSHIDCVIFASAKVWQHLPRPMASGKPRWPMIESINQGMCSSGKRHRPTTSGKWHWPGDSGCGRTHRSWPMDIAHPMSGVVQPQWSCPLHITQWTLGLDFRLRYWPSDNEK